MADNSAIEWTNSPWNPVTGCTKIGPGCENCYAQRFAERWRGIEGHPYEQGFDLRLWPSRLRRPFQWKKPRMIFVNSMSDLFHRYVDRQFIDKVFDAMEAADWHVYQVLTKRSSLMRHYVCERYRGGEVPAHIWLGVSVEDAAHKGRIDHLRRSTQTHDSYPLNRCSARLAQSICPGIAWAIVGGESGPKARSMVPSWATELRDKCETEGVAFFFKQWGGARPKSGGRLLEGEEWNGFPWQIVPQEICKSLQR